MASKPLAISQTSWELGLSKDNNWFTVARFLRILKAASLLLLILALRRCKFHLKFLHRFLNSGTRTCPIRFCVLMRKHSVQLIAAVTLSPRNSSQSVSNYQVKCSPSSQSSTFGRSRVASVTSFSRSAGCMVRIETFTFLEVLSWSTSTQLLILIRAVLVWESTLILKAWFRYQKLSAGKPRNLVKQL